MDVKQIIKTISSQLPFLKERFHVKSIGLFGSVARGEGGSDSDIDILVEFESSIGFFDFIRLENFLSKVLKRKVDLISRKAIKPIIRDVVLKEVIYV